MKFELFTLCDGAYNYNGRLTIVGTYDNVLAKSFPWKTDLVFAMKLFVPKSETGKKKISLKFLNTVGNNFAADINAQVDIPKSETNGHIAFSSVLRGVSFDKPGTYVIRIEENDKKLKEFAFDVMQG